ncbi:hypothetical protein JTE90_019703 [Oedothorax gibbosus]|uniref:Bcl-2 Bcl-2 homology region 1-3 domain-containing protein n=1 Tax=Oedothorax gibbosus TaxID=931172 RepID=A0AAV6U271_9ARAC|nr:hypothetical protein JTE90_019703 [Oedothorax gibbosus]
MFATPVVTDEIEVGRHVFHNFVHQQFVGQGLSDEEILQDEVEDEENGFVDENFAVAHMEFHRQLSGTPEGYKSIAISQVGTAIRQLANEFAQSRQRKTIEDHAKEIDLSALNKDHFWGLLEEVFRDGITSHNLIALFFFCSDVLIRCVRLKLRDIGMNLFRWSLMYITDKVVKWVHDNGGWENVLRKALLYKKILATVAIGAIAIGSYLVLKGLKK